MRCALGIVAALATQAAADEATVTWHAVPAPVLTLDQPLRRSHAWAATHVAGVNAGFSLIGLALGKPYLRISPSSIWENLGSDWVWDEDAFDTNQFGHPYLGGLMFNAARSNGIGFWGAAIYSFVGSAFWELVMETETPSINDQIFTPTSGILLGEALHRFGRTIRWNRGRGSSLPREILSGIVDPMGLVSRLTHGDAWMLTPPPARFGYVAIGLNGRADDFEGEDGGRLEKTLGRLHVALGSSYGLPTDAGFQPRRPLDHYDFLIEGDLSTEGLTIALHTRGLIWGRAFERWGVRAAGGLMASYDFTNPERVRVGAFGLGVGAVAHTPLGDVGFLQASVMATVIPFGGAGSEVDEDATGPATERDYHRGPGTAQLLEVKLGRLGLGLIHFTSRSFYIDGAYFDEGSELIELARLGVLWSVYGSHSIDVEAEASARRATFVGAERDTTDSVSQFRISYVYASDLAFGGGRR